MSDTYLPELVVPHISKHILGRLELDCVTVKLSPTDWDVCDATSKHYWSSKKGGSYGKGIINTPEDPTKTERTGLLGEAAFAKISGLEMDTSYREKGDDYDFICSAGTIDVKNASKLSSYKQMLAYASSATGKPIELKADYFVASFLAYEDIALKKATVVIVGWCTKADFMKGGLHRAKKGSHMNYQIHYRDLKPIAELLELINPELETYTVKPEEEDAKANP